MHSALGAAADSAERHDPSRAGVPGCPASRYTGPVRSAKRSREQAVLLAWQAASDAELPAAWLLAGIYWGVPGRFSRLENADAEPRTASDAIAAMDQRTWQAHLTTGHVELPCRRIPPVVVSTSSHAAR